MVLAGFYSATGYKEKALTAYLRALEIQPDNVQIMTTIARHYYKDKDIENAQKYIAQVFKTRPNYYPARMLTGEIQISQKEFGVAIETFNNLIKDEPKAAVVYYYRGIAYIGNGEASIAKTEIAKAIELNPKFIKARLIMAEIHMRGRDFKLAQKESDEVLKLLPDSFQATLLRGNASLFQKKPDIAKASFEKLIELEPQNPVGYFRLGLLYRLMRKYEPALENFDKALSLKPLLMDVFSNVILVHAAQKV